MLYRFLSFELDEEVRELRLDGSRVPLQPLAFRLLLYLVAHRDRLVRKEELLRVLWPDAIVTDASVQRAVSLARSALRRGEAANAIRTHSREGYRFSADVRCVERSSNADLPSAEEHPELPRAAREARSACDRACWSEALERFTEADREHGLGASDLERWAYAAQCVGNQTGAIPPLERATAAYAMAGSRRSAARAALSLVRIHFEQRQGAVAAGWHRRAARLLSGEETASEHGHLEWLASRLALADGRLDEALEHAKRAHRLGRSLGDVDLEVLGLLCWGLASLALGDVESCVGLHDEAAAATLASKVGPLVGGFVYCGVIWGCRNRYDWDRAAQWTDHFTRWCAESGMEAYPGTCRLHRAEVLCVRGELAEAETEVSEASTHLSRTAPWAEGEARRILGDIRRLQGRYDAADEAYRHAYELGWDPQPGHAMLQLARGNARDAVRELERSLEDRTWSSRQRRGLLLAHIAMAAAVAGDVPRANEALSELGSRPELHATPALAATVARARGEAAHAGGATDQAVRFLRQALQLWQEVGSVVNVARTRLRLAELLLALDDSSAFELELSLAESSFRKIGSVGLLRHCEELRRGGGPPAVHARAIF